MPPLFIVTVQIYPWRDCLQCLPLFIATVQEDFAKLTHGETCLQCHPLFIVTVQ